MKNPKRPVLISTSIGSVISVVSGGTMIIAVPTIMKEFGFGLMIGIWLVMGYMLTMTVLVPAFGKLADITSKKTIFISGFLVFAVGSLLCALSSSGAELMFFRVVQATGGSMIVANSTGIAAGAYPQGQTGRAMGVSAMLTGIGSVAGPIVGGLLTGLGWRFIFYINIPLGVLGAVYAAFAIKEKKPEKTGEKYDITGMLLFSLTMLLLLLAITYSGFHEVSGGEMWVLYIAAAFAGYLLIYIEKQVEKPFFDVSMFRSRTLRFAYLECLLNSLAIGACAFLLIFYYQGVKGYTPLVAGLYITPMVIPMLFVSPIFGKLADKHGSKIISGIALLVSAVGSFLMTNVSANTPNWQISLWILIIGFGAGMFFAPNSRAVLRLVRPEQRGVATGMRVLAANTGNVISIAVSMAIIAWRVSPTQLEALFVEKEIGTQSVTSGYFIEALHIVFLISCICNVCAALVAFLRRPAPKDALSTAQEEATENRSLSQDNETLV